jgi:hypothetical protein
MSLRSQQGNCSRISQESGRFGMCWALATHGPSYLHLPSDSYQKSTQLITYNVWDVYSIYALTVTNGIDVIAIILHHFARVYPSNIFVKVQQKLERFESVTTLNTRRDRTCQRQLSIARTVFSRRSPSCLVIFFSVFCKAYVNE